MLLRVIPVGDECFVNRFFAMRNSKNEFWQPFDDIAAEMLTNNLVHHHHVKVSGRGLSSPQCFWRRILSGSR
jgi:hypothetical protein